MQWSMPLSAMMVDCERFIHLFQTDCAILYQSIKKLRMQCIKKDDKTTALHKVNTNRTEKRGTKFVQATKITFPNPEAQTRIWEQ